MNLSYIFVKLRKVINMLQILAIVFVMFLPVWIILFAWLASDIEDYEKKNRKKKGIYHE